MGDELSFWKIAEREIPWEKNRAFQRLAAEAARIAEERNLSRKNFCDDVRQLYDAYGDFLSATNPGNVEPEDHIHWRNRYRDARLGKKLGEPPITQELLSGAAYSYLKGSLRVPTFDRGLIDAFVAQETFAYIDGHAGRGPFLTQLGCLGSWFLLFVGYELLFGGADANWTRLWWGIGGLLLLILVLWAWPKRGPFALYRAMRDTYQLLTGSVVSVPELRRRVNRARDAGVVWPPELYALLDDVEDRTKVL